MFRTGAFQIGAVVALIAVLAAVAIPSSASAAELDVADLFVSYDSQSASTATGTIQFNLRFNASGAGDYDLFSSQVLIARMGLGAEAKFTLNEAATEDTGAIGGTYWLPSPPTTFQNASTIGSEFRFTDFVSVAQGIVPTAGDIVARFVVGFTVENASQFGDYEIAMGDSANNYFNSDFINRYDNTINGATFQLAAVPEPATLLPLLASLVLLRRRR